MTKTWPAFYTIKINSTFAGKRSCMFIVLFFREKYSQIRLSPNAFFEDEEPFLTNFKFSVLNKTFVNKNQTISVLPLGATVLQKVCICYSSLCMLYEWIFVRYSTSAFKSKIVLLDTVWIQWAAMLVSVNDIIAFVLPKGRKYCNVERIKL